MNPIDRDVSSDNDHRFDLLVDGELSESQRRELLAGLDDEPDGWRRCALALLEAQCWQNEFGSMVGELDESAPALRRSPPRRRHVGPLLAVAASFLVALLLGSQLQPLWRGQPVDPAPQPQVADVTDDIVEPVPQPADTPSTPWQMVSLDAVDGSGEPVQLPAIERETIDQQWLQGRPTAMPDEVLQALQQSGHRIRQHRQWLPLRMKDGRRLVVPVEQVDVRYVGLPTL